MFIDYIPRILLEKDYLYLVNVVVGLGLIMFVLASFYPNLNLNLVNLFVILIVIYYFFNIYLQKEYTDVGNFNRITKYKLDKIQSNFNDYVKKRLERSNFASKEDYAKQLNLSKLNYLYIDVNFIHFLDNIEYLYKQNPQTYILLTKSINNILKLRWDSEQIHRKAGGPSPSPKLQEFEKRQLYYNFQETERLSQVANNHFHSFIFTMPKSNLSYKHHTMLFSKLQKLLMKAMYIQRYYYNASIKDAISTSTKFLPNEHVHTKPNDDFGTNSNFYFM